VRFQAVQGPGMVKSLLSYTPKIKRPGEANWSYNSRFYGVKSTWTLLLRPGQAQDHQIFVKIISAHFQGARLGAVDLEPQPYIQPAGGGLGSYDT
jgi:hypothetical protein